jgi:hypothetical protein
MTLETSAAISVLKKIASAGAREEASEDWRWQRPSARTAVDNRAMDCTRPPCLLGTTSWRAAYFFMIKLKDQVGTEGTLGWMTTLMLEGVIGTGFRGYFLPLDVVLRNRCADLLLAPNGNFGQGKAPAWTEAAREVEARHVVMRTRPGGRIGGPHLCRARGDAMPKVAPRPSCERATTAGGGSACARLARRARTQVTVSLPLEVGPLALTAMTGASYQ